MQLTVLQSFDLNTAAHLYLRALRHTGQGQRVAERCHTRNNITGAMQPHVFLHSYCLGCGTVHEEATILPVSQCCSICKELPRPELLQQHGIQLTNLAWQYATIDKYHAFAIQRALKELLDIQEQEQWHNTTIL